MCKILIFLQTVERCIFRFVPLRKILVDWLFYFVCVCVQCSMIGLPNSFVGNTRVLHLLRSLNPDRVHSLSHFILGGFCCASFVLIFDRLPWYVSGMSDRERERAFCLINRSLLILFFWYLFAFERRPTKKISNERRNTHKHSKLYGMQSTEPRENNDNFLLPYYFCPVRWLQFNKKEVIL